MQKKNRKSAPRDAFSWSSRNDAREMHREGLAVGVLRIVLLTADAPEVGSHGLGTACGVFLREEGLLVGNDLGQIGAACVDHHGYSCETLTRFQLLGGRLSCTVAVDGRVLQASGFHVIVNRAKFLRDLARDVVDRVFKYYFSHS